MFAIFVTIGAITAPPPATTPQNPPAATQQESAGTQIDCTALSADMQAFAAQLSDANRAVFCNQFNDVQRNAAVELATQPDSMGNLMSADLAVRKVAQENDITIPSQSMGSPTGGCPTG